MGDPVRIKVKSTNIANIMHVLYSSLNRYLVVYSKGGHLHGHGHDVNSAVY